MQIKDLIDVVVKSIVDDTDRVQIREEQVENGILFEVTVSKDDVGKLIGKSGRIAGAIRTICKAAGAKMGVRVLVNVMNKPLEE